MRYMTSKSVYRYEKKGCRFGRKYGKTLKALAKELNVSIPAVSKWDRLGYDIYEKAESLNSFRSIPKKNLHILWGNLKHRCGNPKDKKYKNYGGKGVRLKLEKKDIVFLWHRDKAKLMKKPSLDRLDSEGHYELSNCRFIEHVENCRQGGLK